VRERGRERERERERERDRQACNKDKFNIRITLGMGSFNFVLFINFMYENIIFKLFIYVKYLCFGRTHFLYMQNWTVPSILP
jgi:hypothetical protein